MKIEPESIPEAFHKVVELGLARGYERICDLPGALVLKVDDNWTVAMNGHEEPIDVPEGDGCMGIHGLPPYTIAIWWWGWIAGMVNAKGGEIAFGEMANEDSFIKAVKAATERARNESMQNPPG